MSDEHSLDDEAPPSIPDISSDPDVEVPSDPDIEVPDDGRVSDLDVDVDVEVPSEPGEPIEPELIEKKGKPPPRRRHREPTNPASPQAHRESFRPDPEELSDPTPESLRAPKTPTFAPMEPAIAAKEASEPPPRASQPPRPVSQPPRPVSQPPRPVSQPLRPVSQSPRPVSQPPRATSEPPIDLPPPRREASAPEIEVHHPSPPPPPPEPKRISSVPPSEPPDSEPPVVEPSLPPPPMTAPAPPAAAAASSAPPPPPPPVAEVPANRPSTIPPPSSEVPTPPLARSSPPADAATSYPPPPVAMKPVPAAPPDPGPQSLRPMRIIQVKQDAVAASKAEREAKPPVPPPPPQSESLEETDISFPSDESDHELSDSDIAPEDPESERVSQVEIVDEASLKDKGQKPPPPPPPRRDSGKIGKDAPAVSADEARLSKQRKAWWEELFGEDFARANARLKHGQITREADFIEESLGVAKGGTVLDLACGGGYHAVELATRGYGVVGYDLSLYQLAVAADVAQETDQKLNLLQGDMREMAFEETFDGIFCWNTSFGYFEEEKNSAVAQRIFRALRPGGMFLLDVANRDFVVANQPCQTWFEGDACVCMDDMSVDFITSRLRVKRSLILDDGRTLECSYSIRLYGLHELGKILHDVGFRVTEASGHPATPGVFFGASSPRIIILAQRP
jgi:SAM-dependent methyltransferase